MMLKVAQKSATEILKRSENDLKIKNVKLNIAMEKQLNIIGFSKEIRMVFQGLKVQWKLRFAWARLPA